MISKIDAQAALLNLEKRIDEADSQFDDWIMTGNEYSDPEWVIESCFLQLLALTESLGFNAIYQMAFKEYSSVASSKAKFDAVATSPDGDPYSTVLGRIRCFKRALDSFFPEEPTISVTKDVLQILRDVHYSISDTRVFGTPPESETDVHLRIEAILKCVFPDLKHKPTLTKQIKNFEPDTGIPSVDTLIEYKFLSRREDAPLIADQILADTRGYTSPEWKRFLYVVYETQRFRKEAEWNQLLRESNVPENTVVVVLSGVPASSLHDKDGNRKRPTKSSTKRRMPGGS